MVDSQLRRLPRTDAATAAGVLTDTHLAGSLRTLPAGCLFALQFLSVAPPALRRQPTTAELGAAEAFFPAVGLLLGLGLVGLDWLLGWQLQPSVRDVLLVAALAVATGALHLDGVVDTFDGIVGPGDAEARLQALRDPRAGAFGVVGVVCVLLLKVAALGALPDRLRPAALILGPCLGRWAIVQATWTFPYARRDGLGRAFKDGMRGGHVLVAAATAAGAAVWLLGPAGLALATLVTAAVWVLGRLMVARLGGLTGDTYGGLCELAEAATWLAVGAVVLAGSP